MFGKKTIRKFVTPYETREFILAALGNVDKDHIFLERDSATGTLVAKVFLRGDQLDEALRENGRYVREASIESGVRIDVTFATEWPGITNRWTE